MSEDLTTTARQQRRLKALHKVLDFLNCDCWITFYTKLVWWRTRQKWCQRNPHVHPEAGTPPRFCWQLLPDRLRQEGGAGGCLTSLRTQLELLEGGAWSWCPLLPRSVVRHIQVYLTSSDKSALVHLQHEQTVQWANALRLIVQPLYEAEAARLRSDLHRRSLEKKR